MISAKASIKLIQEYRSERLRWTQRYLKFPGIAVFFDRDLLSCTTSLDSHESAEPSIIEEELSSNYFWLFPWSLILVNKMQETRVAHALDVAVTKGFNYHSSIFAFKEMETSLPQRHSHKALSLRQNDIYVVLWRAASQRALLRRGPNSTNWHNFNLFLPLSPPFWFLCLLNDNYRR